MRVRLLKTKLNNCVIASPIGKLGLTIVNNKLTKIVFLPSKVSLFCTKSSATKQFIAEIKKYFRNPRLGFKLSTQTKGTPLQQKIWRTIKKIPCSKTVTYGELAQKIGTNPRVIGNACRRNPIPIIIPCHRVVATTGYGGYCGSSHKDFLKIKKWLLNHEYKK
jgi:methylated-DNA-[protein]-cysteine S-methyltransferase